jgi:hypothetical protein
MVGQTMYRPGVGSTFGHPLKIYECFSSIRLIQEQEDQSSPLFGAILRKSLQNGHYLSIQGTRNQAL